MKHFEHNNQRYYVQLLLLPESPEERNAREIKELKHSCDKLRKSLHAKNGSLAKQYSELRHELEQLKSAMCHSQTIEQQQRSLF